MSDRVVVESIPAATTLVAAIKRWGTDLGFARLGVATIDLAGDEAHFRDWLLAGFNGEMEYMSRHGAKRTRPSELVRTRLQKLCDRIAAAIGPFGYRAFADSAPVLEKALARNAGLGWIGKHTNLIDSQAGSYFFLGEIYLDCELPAEEAATAHCGSCTACIPACPTGAIVAPYRLDARRCISYL